MSDRPTLPPTASVVTPQDGDRLSAPAASRNAEAITDLLRAVAPPRGRALELASGTGQHVIRFARALPDLHWQPTEVAPDRLRSIAAYLDEAALPNVAPPAPLDATAPGWAADWGGQDLILLVNLLHLIALPRAETLITQAAAALAPGGVLVLYGPFLRTGELTSDGDAAFHASLIASDPTIGYKDDFDMLDLMQSAGLDIRDVIEMPANNLALIAARPAT